MKRWEFSIKVFYVTGGSQWHRGFMDWTETDAEKKRIATDWVTKNHPGSRFIIR